MSGAEAAANQLTEELSAKPAAGRRKLLLLLAVPAALAAAGAGGWFSGILPKLLGMNQHADKPQPVFVDLPEMVANLNSDPRRPRYVKLKAQIQIPGRQDLPAVTAGMSRLQDLFQTYLREMRPEDLQGSAGTYRLRQELIARANVALAPVKVQDVLFVEVLIQ
ncbi:MAG TPA: flagellar basal body-associated FliL family protein [Acetobacteraceae bacterium]